MKAISLWQPWASALFALREDGTPIKPDETRHWPLPEKYLGVEVAIHAALRDTPEQRDFWLEQVIRGPWAPINQRAFESLGISDYYELPRGQIVGKVVFDRCRETTGQANEPEIAREWGIYSPGRYAWRTSKRTAFAEPIVCTGRQGFFNWEPPV